jgi:hypothetical protein
MWTEPIDTAEQDQADTAAATTARRRQANREIRSRGLCPHDGYSGTDPITGVVLCALCRAAGQHTPAYPDRRRPAPRPGTESQP